MRRDVNVDRRVFIETFIIGKLQITESSISFSFSVHFAVFKLAYYM